MVFRIKKLPDIWVAELIQAPSQPVMKIALVLNTTDSATVLLFQLLDVEPVGVAEFWRERIDAGKAFNLFFHFVWRGAAVEKRLTAERIAAIEAPFDTATVDLMASVLREEDSGARAVPYMISGGTDAKSFSTLGIACYGFSPLKLPAGIDYWRMFHGVDERVPVDGLQFGVRVLDRFLRAC